MASARLGVRPISKAWSVRRPRCSAAGMPTLEPGSSTKMPSCEVPSPSSSSAQIMPWLSTPRILAFLMVSSEPSAMCSVQPTVATSTF